MSFIAFIGFQGVNSSTPVSLRYASGWLLTSPAGGVISICVCLLELSSAATPSERGGDLRLSFGAGADLSTGTCSTGGSCATAPAASQRQTRTRKQRKRTSILYANPEPPTKTHARFLSPMGWISTSRPAATRLLASAT